MGVYKYLFLILFAFTFLLFNDVDLAYSQEQGIDIQYEKVNPDNSSKYLGKRLKEKIILFFNFSHRSKANYYQDLLGKRLAELKYIVDKKDLAHIEKTSQRYEATAGMLTERIIDEGLTDQKESSISLFKKHMKIIDNIKNTFEYGTAEYRFVVNDHNSLKIYSDKLSEL